MRGYFGTVRCVLSNFKYARRYGRWGLLFQVKGLLFVLLNWRNARISNWNAHSTAVPVWISEPHCCYEMDGSAYPTWHEIVVDIRWWVPGFNEERVC